jgi:hypothetical protein
MTRSANVTVQVRKPGGAIVGHTTAQVGAGQHTVSVNLGQATAGHYVVNVSATSPDGQTAGDSAPLVIG